MSTDDVLLAQIEHARAEVFYTQSPYRYGSDFMRQLPGSVRKRVCWHSPPAPVGDLTSYDLIVNNFPRSLELYGTQGVRTAYFTPSFDSVMADYCDNDDHRPIDIAFVGGYSRHHRQRAAILEAVAKLGGEYHVRFALAPGRLTRLAETPAGWLPLLLQARSTKECAQCLWSASVWSRHVRPILESQDCSERGCRLGCW